MQLIVRALVNRFASNGLDWIILDVGGFCVRWPRDLLPPDVKPGVVVDITVRRDDDATGQFPRTKFRVRTTDGT